MGGPVIAPLRPPEGVQETRSSAAPVPTRPLRVALVCMPFNAADRPSIQIGLLGAIVSRAGHSADTFHLNLDLAARITDAYDGLCSHRGRMTGEWLFSVAAFGDRAPADDAAYFAAFPEEVAWAEKCGKDAAFLSHLRHELLPAYIDDCLEAVDWGQYDVVGFTSTFQQNVASLALARRIKERHPATTIVFGGANMEDEMGPEYVRVFPFIDYAVIGEGDQVFQTLLTALAEGRHPQPMTGLARRNGEGVIAGGQALPVRDLDALPVPSYDEYFRRAADLDIMASFDRNHVAMVPFESSRGCWWGQKHHCTFCGLNGLGMAYRAKSPARLLDELTELARRHRISFFGATDNILDMKYVRDFFSTIQETRTDYQFFYEVKANLTPEQLGALHRGGVRWVQPGIESLSSHVLQLMRKGSTMLQNVRLLKWCRYYRIRVSWNLIWGFPGETEADYAEELRILRLLPHLEPPHGCIRIWLERFSPYFDQQQEFQLTNIRPEPSYGYVYPDDVALDKVAYSFEYEMADTLPAESHLATQQWVEEWRSLWDDRRPPKLTYRRTSDAIFIDDDRSPERRGVHAFYGPMARIYEACSETMHSARQVAAGLRAGPDGDDYPDEEVGVALDSFCERGLMVGEDGLYLSLAVPTNPNW